MSASHRLRFSTNRVRALVLAGCVAGTALIGWSSPASAAAGQSFLNPGQQLNQGQQIKLNDASFVMQNDGNAVLYRAGRACWATATNGKGGVSVVWQTDGNLVVYASGGRAIWASNTNYAGRYLTLLFNTGSSRTALVAANSSDAIVLEAGC
jgi:hypothetical protein